jgi:FkbM family methyltransferase
MVETLGGGKKIYDIHDKSKFDSMITQKDLNHRGIGKLYAPHRNPWGSIWKDWQSDHEKFMEDVKEFNIVVQAGGCFGMYPALYGTYFNEVYTFEPDPLNFYCLDKNCQGDKFHKYEGGLGNSDRSDWMLNHLGDAGGHYLTHYEIGDVKKGRLEASGKPGTVQMYKLDDLDLPGLDLLHLDTEGSGSVDAIVMGGYETIKKYLPVIVAEWGGGNLENKLTNLGYVEKYVHHRDTKMDSVFVVQ